MWAYGWQARAPCIVLSSDPPAALPSVCHHTLPRSNPFPWRLPLPAPPKASIFGFAGGVRALNRAAPNGRTSQIQAKDWPQGRPARRGVLVVHRWPSKWGKARSHRDLLRPTDERQAGKGVARGRLLGRGNGRGWHFWVGGLASQKSKRRPGRVNPMRGAETLNHGDTTGGESSVAV